MEVSTALPKAESSQENKRITQFMDLPLEIRWMIYVHAGMTPRVTQLPKYFKSVPFIPPLNSLKVRIITALLPRSISTHINRLCQRHSAPISTCLDQSKFTTKPLRLLIQFRPTFLQVCKESRDKVYKEFHFQNKSRVGLSIPGLISTGGPYLHLQNPDDSISRFIVPIMYYYFYSIQSRRLTLDVEFWEFLWGTDVPSNITLGYLTSLEYLELVFPASSRKEVAGVCKGEFDPRGAPLWFRGLERLHDELNDIMRDHTEFRYPAVELHVFGKELYKWPGEIFDDVNCKVKALLARKITGHKV